MKSILLTPLFLFILIAVSFFLALMILIGHGHNSVTDEILRFIFLSGLVISFLASLLFVDIQFGTQSPLGLVKQSDTKNEYWTFSIGGTIQIPVYVIVFGLLGGYIRYLYKTSRMISPEGRRERNKQGLENKYEAQKDRRLIFFLVPKRHCFVSSFAFIIYSSVFLAFQDWNEQFRCNIHNSKSLFWCWISNRGCNTKTDWFHKTTIIR